MEEWLFTRPLVSYTGAVHEKNKAFLTYCLHVRCIHVHVHVRILYIFNSECLHVQMYAQCEPKNLTTLMSVHRGLFPDVCNKILQLRGFYYTM